jgi:hypothetical protein
VEIQAKLDPVNRWVLIELEVSGGVSIDMVLDTGSPLSTISAGTRDKLAGLGWLNPVPGAVNRFLLTNVRIQGQPIDDLIVRVSPITTRAGAGGTLGLDFLNRFELIQFHVPTPRLTLT